MNAKLSALVMLGTNCIYASSVFFMTFISLYRFKRLTGRTEAAVSARDYKFYAPRHKYRRVSSNSISIIPGLPVSFDAFAATS